MAPAPWAAPAPLTHAQLREQRQSFWGSRAAAGGAEQTWATLKMAAEAMLEDDIDTANVICEAAQITVPGGVLSEAYDATGRRYTVEPACFSTPTNLIIRSSAATNDGGHSDSIEAGISSTAATGQTASAAAAAAATATGDNNMTLHIQVFGQGHNGTERRSVRVAPSMSVAAAKQEFASEQSTRGEEPVPVSRQRYIFGGRELDDAQTLASCGVTEDAVVQLMIRPQV
eukprot:g1007.t1